MTRPYLTTLTPLRGIAALMMVIFHFNLLVLPIIDPAITQLHRRWYLLVDFFFILSGFIMTYVYGSWFEDRVLIASLRLFPGLMLVFRRLSSGGKIALLLVVSGLYYGLT